MSSPRFPATIRRWRPSPGERPRAGRRRLVLPGCGAIACGFAAPAENEVQTEAGRLYPHAEFAGWPERPVAPPDTPLVVTVLGDERAVGIISAEEE